MKNILYSIRILCLIFISNYAFAQGTLKGVVKDEIGQDVIGANVLVKGTELGTSTEFDGSYIIEDIPLGLQTIQFTYVGYKTLDLQVEIKPGNNVLDATISEDSEMIGEVVVVGYGTQRRRELVGNISRVDGKTVEEASVGGSFQTALQGKAAGVQITQGSGSAGGHAIIRIRGISSISAGGDPLFVIDGVPVSADNYILGEAGGLNNNPLSSINPADIESIEVLKDASAAAIYGSRAANGVILITTKRGKEGKLSFNYSTKFGVSTPTNIIDVLNSDQWQQVQQEAWENSGNVGRFVLPNGLTYDDIEGINTDWIDEVITTGWQQEHNLSARFGKKWINTYAGLSYSNTASYLIKNNFERISGRLNMDITPSDKITFSISSSVARGLRNKTPQAWAGGLGWAQSTSLPIYPIYKSDFPTESAQYAEEGYYNIYNNPIAQVNLTSLRTFEMRYLNSGRLTYRPTEKLSIALQGNYDFTNIGDYGLEGAEWTTTTAIAKASLFKIRNFSTTGTAEYTFIDNEKHGLKLLGGVEYQSYERDRLYAERDSAEGHYYQVGAYKDEIDELNYISDEGYKFFSFFGRLNYDYKDKYLAQIVYRRDASSKFGRNNRWGDFPSIGLGYIMSEESWWPQGEKLIVNYLKLKSSFGITGNSNIPWTEQFAIFAQSPNPGTLEPGFSYNNQDTEYQTKSENPDLKWETVQTFDIGAELGLWNDRVTTSLTYYHKLTRDALLREFLAASSGYDRLEFYKNIGKIRNQGVEWEITTNNITGALSWTTDFNIAANRNIVLDVGNATPDALDGGFGDIRVIEGFPIGANFIVPFSHVDPETGKPVYLDQDGNETFEYNPATMRQPVGDIQPDFIGSITNRFNYKNFDLDFMFYFSLGGKIYDDAAKRHMGVVSTDWNMRPLIFDRWKEYGDVATYPAFATSMTEWGGSGNIWQNNHSLWLYDASFVRLRYVQLGYEIPLKNKKVIKRAKVFVRGNNLLTFTKYPGWDPEIARDRTQSQERNVGGTNVTYLTPPQEKSFFLGVSVDF